MLNCRHVFHCFFPLKNRRIIDTYSCVEMIHPKNALLVTMPNLAYPEQSITGQLSFALMFGSLDHHYVESVKDFFTSRNKEVVGDFSFQLWAYDNKLGQLLSSQEEACSVSLDEFAGYVSLSSHVCRFLFSYTSLFHHVCGTVDCFSLFITCVLIRERPLI